MLKFMYRGVYYECGCCCTSVVLQEGVGHFKNGISQSFECAMLVFVSIMIMSR